MVSVKDFGAAGDGLHDDYAALQRALDSGAGEIRIPMGIYAVSRTLLCRSDTHILADRAAKLVMRGTVRRKRNDFLLSSADTVRGERNIAITGGIWDGDNTAEVNRKPDLFDRDGYSGAVLNFVNVQGLTLRDMTVANSVTFYVRMGRLTDFLIENIDLISDAFGMNQDGLHFGGEVRHGVVRNIRALSKGQTNDDMIALNADDCVERVENLDLVRGPIEDIRFENLYAERCYTVIRMLSVTAPIRDISIRGVYAGFRYYLLNADAARYCRTPLFDEEAYPDGVGAVERVTLEDFTCVAPPAGEEKTAAAFVCETKMKDVRLSNFRYLRPEGQTLPALTARYIPGTRIRADGTTCLMKTKQDALRLDDFRELEIGTE